MVEGEYREHKITFLEVKAPLLTDDSFRARSDGEYHKGHCLLEFLPIYIIKDVNIYYVHAVLGSGGNGTSTEILGKK